MWPDMEAVMTREPVLRSRKWWPTALAQWNVPVKSVSMTSFHASTLASKIPASAVFPALAMKTSILPKSLMTSLTSCCTFSQSPTWHL